MSETSRAIVKLPSVDIGGITPLADEMITSETVGSIKIRALDTTLLTADDPLYNEYLNFLNTVNVGVATVIDDDSLGKGDGYFDKVDLSGDEANPESFNIDPATYYMCVAAWAAGGMGLNFMPPEGLKNPFSKVTKYKDGEYVDGFEFKPEIVGNDMILLD